MRLVLKAERQTKCSVVGLKQSISILALVESSHCRVELLKAIFHILEGSVSVGEVSAYNPRHRQVIPQICALHSTSARWQDEDKKEENTVIVWANMNVLIHAHWLNLLWCFWRDMFYYVPQAMGITNHYTHFRAHSRAEDISATKYTQCLSKSRTIVKSLKLWNITNGSVGII